MVTPTDSQLGHWQSHAIIENGDDSPIAKQYTRAKLVTARDITRELAKLYRAAKAGQMDASLATKLTYILQTMAKIQVDAELETRIEELENRSRGNR